MASRKTQTDATQINDIAPVRAECVRAGRTALYRHFDAGGALLYVGISLNAIARLGQHRLTASWFESIARIELEWFATREAAADAERVAIQTERPIHNIIHVGIPDELRRMLRAIGKEHMVGPDGLLLPEYASLTPEEADALSYRLG